MNDAGKLCAHNTDLPTAGTHKVRGFIENSEFVHVYRNHSHFNNLLLHPLRRH